MARMLRGQGAADRMLMECGVKIFTLREQGFHPAMASVVVGSDKIMLDAAEQVRLACARISMDHRTEHFGEYASDEDVIKCIDALNDDDKWHGIHLAMPLPEGRDPLPLVSAILPRKDATGLNPLNIGRSLEGIPNTPEAATAKALMVQLQESKVKPKGLKAAVVGRDWTACRPVAAMLDRAGATVTALGRDDPDLKAACRQADILVVRENSPGLIKGDMVKPGSVVIDAGLTRQEDRVSGDVDLKTAAPIAKYLSTAPGGFEPVEVAVLLRNALRNAMIRESIRRRMEKREKAAAAAK